MTDDPRLRTPLEHEIANRYGRSVPGDDPIRVNLHAQSDPGPEVLPPYWETNSIASTFCELRQGETIRAQAVDRVTREVITAGEDGTITIPHAGMWCLRFGRGV